MDSRQLADSERAMNAVRSVIRALRLNSRATERAAGISLAQLFVLQQLADAPAASLGELATRTATHLSSVSVVVDRLVGRELVTRTQSTEDKRRYGFALSDKGRALVDTAPRTVQADLLDALRRLPAREQSSLAALLERWLTDAGID
jgi:DNA-binding MarR family transcriptional regulator